MHKSNFLLLSILVFATILNTTTSISLSDGVYSSLQLTPNTNQWVFQFQHPTNAAVSSKTINTFSVVFSQAVPAGSTMSLSIQRDGNTQYSSQEIQASRDNIFTFNFLELGGSLVLFLNANAALTNTGYLAYVVFNIEPVIVKQPNFTDTANFIYTQQVFKGTYSQFRLYNAYQINMLQSGYLLLKKYDCVGHVEFALTQQLATDTTGKALGYQTLIVPPAGDISPQYTFGERIYQVNPGIYYIMILPGYGFPLNIDDGPRAYYRLEAQLLPSKPAQLEIPSAAFNNLDSLQIDESKDSSVPIEIVFDSFEKGLPTILNMEVTYKTVVTAQTTFRDYYLGCGIDAPDLKVTNTMLGRNTGVEWNMQRREANSDEEFVYQVQNINLENTGLAAGAEVQLTLVENDGNNTVTGRIFYQSQNVRKKANDDVDVKIIIYIVVGLLVVLAFPVFKIIQKFVRNKRRQRKASRYEIDVPNYKDKSSMSKINRDYSVNLDMSSFK